MADPSIPKTIAEYQTLVSRLKQLSKAQTALLKAHLHKKLSAARDLIAKAVDLSKDPKLAEIKNAFHELRLEDIQVDVTSPQLLFAEDLAALRKVAGGITSQGNDSGGAGGDPERLQSLESENANLRELLQQARMELMSKSGGGGGGGIDQASLQKEIDTVKAEMTRQADLAKVEMARQADQRLKDLEAKFEAEKEEMMEAMAQEVDGKSIYAALSFVHIDLAFLFFSSLFLFFLLSGDESSVTHLLPTFCPHPQISRNPKRPRRLPWKRRRKHCRRPLQHRRMRPRP